MKTALVFLAGPPDATNTTVSTDRSAANADKKETITVTLTPRDSHNNVVPLWTFRKDLTIVPSVNATVPGAVTVTTPAQDAAGAVAATLTYVDTSGKLLSKEARAGTTTITIGKTVKQTVDTRFYPQVHVCLTNLDSNGFVTPGTTEVHLCDGSGHTIPSGSGYSVEAPGLSSAACPPSGGGVCPSDAAGVKADFENLTGPDIVSLVQTTVNFSIHDTYAAQEMQSRFPDGNIAFYSELSTHGEAKNLQTTGDLFRTKAAHGYCASFNPSYIPGDDVETAAHAAAAVMTGTKTGGTVTYPSEVKSVFMGNIANAITTGGDTNPELFVSGVGKLWEGGNWPSREIYYDLSRVDGTYFPTALVFVNGRGAAATSWTMYSGGVEQVANPHGTGTAFGLKLHTATGWNLSDAYFVNNWPGSPYTTHKGNGDVRYHYVTQVNYITGYICAASLH
ncbi:hypothetical protein FD97_25510 [Salmonella enterica subsp. enterica serovar Muenchen]|nr:hypothetical protein [Salmonella enterica subsp. enterica serovar Muenchen]